MLNDRQKTFLDNYLELGNIKQAAIVAGYSEKTASQIGSRILKREDSQEYLKTKQELKNINPKKYVRNLNTAKSVRIMLSNCLNAFLADLNSKGKNPSRQDLQVIGNISNILIKSFEITDFEEQINFLLEEQKIMKEEQKQNQNRINY
jgi:hypothetical protein